MSLKRKRVDDDTSSTDDVFRSAPLEDRASTFVGLFSPTLKPKELQSLPEIQSASHKMWASRGQSDQQSITGTKRFFEVNSQDDGEKFGGKRIEKVLESLRVEGSCVVARWYGGVLLGPVRFDHIEAVAREAIERWQEREIKRKKLEEEHAEHLRLAKALSERDQSITVLRALALEKEEKLKQTRGNLEGDGLGSKDACQPKEPSLSAQAVSKNDYSAMPMERLKALDRARDATISFLLKRIDKAEAEIRSLDESNDIPPSTTGS